MAKTVAERAEEAFDKSAERGARARALTSIILEFKASHRLCAAVASAELFSIAPRSDLAALWRDVEPSWRTDTSSIGQLRALGKLLYLNRNWTASHEVLSAVVASGEVTDLDRILGAYAAEALIRATHDDESDATAAAWQEEALNWLGDVAEESYRAEVCHCRGHILGAVAARSGDRADADRSRHELRRAAEQDQSYVSCWTSAASELGDHRSTIRDSHEVLVDGEKWFGRLTEDDAETVRLEVLFYLGHAFSAVGSPAMAASVFGGFRRQVWDRLQERRRPEDQDALAHVDLFEIEARLRSTGLSDADPAFIVGELTKVRDIQFISSAGGEMADEKTLVEQGLDFVRRVLSEEYELHTLATDASALTNALDRAVDDLDDVTRDSVLRTSVPAGSSARNIRSLLSDSMPDSGVQPVVVALEGVERAIAPMCELAIRDGSTLVVSGTDLAKGDLDSAILADSTRTLDRIELVVQALVAFRAFISDAQYVYGIVPCMDSPALQYQRPTWSLADLCNSLAGRTTT